MRCATLWTASVVLVAVLSPNSCEHQDSLIGPFENDALSPFDTKRFRRNTRTSSKIADNDNSRSQNHDDNQDDVISLEDNEQYREQRDAVKDQWFKQNYQVYREDRDNIPLASDSRGPSVNFVTQRRLQDEREARGYEREGRMIRGGKNDVPARKEPRIRPAEYDRNVYYRDRPKYYDPYPSRFPIDPYRYEDPRFSRYDKYIPNDYEKYRPLTESSRQRRIIYYATLPEVVRSPPNVNLRNRYEYRDRFDDFYPLSPPSFARDPYPYPYRKPYFYEEDPPRTKHPLKVSTDLSVREPKKNPEKRIYSEADRRYAYKTSYQGAKSAEHLV